MGLGFASHLKMTEPRVTAKGYALKANYGMSLEDYNFMERCQDGKCYICKQPPIGKSQQTSILHVDHDHVTGKVRALLCQSCNIALGLVKDNQTTLSAMITYLKKFA